MSDDRGEFSKSFLSLQLQLRTILEDIGGESVLPLLDQLAKLRKSEQNTLIGIFRQALSRYVDSERLTPTDEDIALKKFEEDLYRDLSQALIEDRTGGRQQLEVLPGGKQRSRVVSLTEARARKERQLLQ